MAAPRGYSTVSPYLITSDADAEIGFLISVMNGEEIRRFDDEEGTIIHAEVRIGDSVVMIADGNEAWPPIPSHVHVYVDDVDAVYARALEAGATSAQEPREQEGDSDRRGGVVGPGGITWWIATRQ